MNIKSKIITVFILHLIDVDFMIKNVIAYYLDIVTTDLTNYVFRIFNRQNFIPII